ncbi:tetratricopeptide repeat protein [Pseudanabaena sp. FACHB-2040]|uniref:tetratricopeptide repeat protein n=1 Tax=Pseudanabaena sp. FACHB-2040 TaxID=2692859 RepID=UPI0016876693|nr:tetratricopeptide repeat protein [Pseudanabaena sp. FACHB-2040]MBD2257129.1 tetratricopeptide repeat protein [Pseudanabaena sp. FACHB-2040]
MMSVSRNGGFEQFTDSSFPKETAADFANWYSQGEALADLGHYGEALRYFEEALAIDSTHAEGLLYTAVCLIHLQQPQAALKRCDRILAQYPDYSRAWMFRGVALQRLGRYPEAYAAFDRATADSTSTASRSVSRKIREKLVRLGILI